jgi:Protein of unknown function (DUF3489)
MTDTINVPNPRKPRASKTSTAEEGPLIAAAATLPTVTTNPKPTKPLSKQAQLAALVTRDTGATLEQMIAATGWLPHTTRAALTGLKKKGYAISSDKVDGVRKYRALAPEAV